MLCQRLPGRVKRFIFVASSSKNSLVKTVPPHGWNFRRRGDLWGHGVAGADASGGGKPRCHRGEGPVGPVDAFWWWWISYGLRTRILWNIWWVVWNMFYFPFHIWDNPVSQARDGSSWHLGDIGDLRVTGTMEFWMTFHSVGNGITILTDEVIFFRGVGIPPTSNIILYYYYIYIYYYIIYRAKDNKQWN